MKAGLKLLFAAIFMVMATVNIWAALHLPLGDSLRLFSRNPWAVATLFDAYCGFLTFYVWVLYKERATGPRILWFILVMGLGNVAMSGYLLIQLFRLRADEPVWAVLQRRPA
ncbi:MAG: DUF1475 family protein [Gammaproteobacteria bacterium]|nr:DUF1475 family protein [Gammaproteobacteria bacterium]